MAAMDGLWQKVHASWSRQTRLAAVGLVLLVIIGLVFTLSYVRGAIAARYLEPPPPGGGWSMFSCCSNNKLQVGQVFDVGIEFGNVSPSTSIVLRPVSLPRGLPAHVHLVGQVLLRGGLGAASGWPPGRGDTPPDNYPYWPLDGYQLGPSTPAIIGLGFVADAPGIYLVGPVTVHAEVPLGGVLNQRLPIEMTYQQYAGLCVQVDFTSCDQTLKAQLNAMQGSGTPSAQPPVNQ